MRWEVEDIRDEIYFLFTAQNIILFQIFGTFFAYDRHNRYFRAKTNIC
jgi:hypothetical protein